MEREKVLALFEELVDLQKAKVFNCAKEIVGKPITDDDVLQPNDYPELETHPFFRYEEGVLEGLLSAKMAYLAQDVVEI